MTNVVEMVGVTVRQDQYGRFCLNDLQKAATVGRNPRTVEIHEFMRRRATLDLISGEADVVSKRGRNGGTYVTKTLAVAYAAWVGGSAMMMRLIQDSISLSDIISALDEFEVPEDVCDMYVYAIRERETGKVKLGISKDPERRLKQLQTGNSSQLELVAYRKADNGYADEAECHKLNDSAHVRGEWFESNASLNGPMGEMKLVEVA